MSYKPTNPKDALGIMKAPLSTVPANVMFEVGLAMLEGAAKYGRHNYRASGVRASVYYDAMQRHMAAWWEGEDIDKDSGLPHIVKAIACLVVLRDAQFRGVCEDDRPPSCEPMFDRLNALAADILQRHKDKSPRHFTIKDPEDSCYSETTCEPVLGSLGMELNTP